MPPLCATNRPIDEFEANDEDDDDEEEADIGNDDETPFVDGISVVFFRNPEAVLDWAASGSAVAFFALLPVFLCPERFPRCSSTSKSPNEFE